MKMANETEKPVYQLGDKVRLASGGPVVTVIGHSPNGNIWCQWERYNGQLIDEESFPPESLVPV